jgi:hypothetical protein
MDAKRSLARVCYIHIVAPFRRAPDRRRLGTRGATQVRSVVLVNYFVNFLESRGYVEVLLSYDVTVFEHLPSDVSGTYFLHFFFSFASGCEVLIFFVCAVASSGSSSMAINPEESNCTGHIAPYVCVSVELSAPRCVHLLCMIYFAIVSNGRLLH